MGRNRIFVATMLAVGFGLGAVACGTSSESENAGEATAANSSSTIDQAMADLVSPDGNRGLALPVSTTEQGTTGSTIDVVTVATTKTVKSTVGVAPSIRTSLTRSTTSTKKSTTTASAPRTTKPSSNVQKFSGTVQEVYTDCRYWEKLDSQGKPVSVGPAPCDGGSYIVVNGTKIKTSTGEVPENLAFAKHIQNLRAGETVNVVASKPATDPKMFTLYCDQCSLKRA